MRTLMLPLVAAILGATIVAGAFLVAVGRQAVPIGRLEPLLVTAQPGFEAAQAGGASPLLVLGVIVGACLFGISGLFFIEIARPTFRGRRIRGSTGR